MTDVYLEKLKLKGFRSYASETEVTFPAGPGLTVIVGPNGLGKSTLFDAIEWGLTGELRRLSSMDAKAPEKKAALGQKPEVQLWFNDAAHIYRSLNKATISNTQVTNVGDWLTGEKWRGVTSIADCLQLTHFLGQSSRQMFVHLDGKQRWGLLEGPAGLQSLWKVESTLGRRQTDLGFDRVQQDFLQAESKVQEKIKRIQDLQEQLRAKRDLERADDTLAPEEILSRCERVRDELAVALGTTALTQGLSGTGISDVDGILQSQRMSLESAEQQLANQRAQLAHWSNLAQQYATALANQTDLRLSRELVAQEFTGIEAEVTAAVKQVAQFDAERQALSDRYAAQQKVRDAIHTEIDRNSQILALDGRHQIFKRQTDELTAKSDEHGRLIATNKETLGSLELRRSRHTELVERSAMLKALTIQCEVLLKEHSQRHTARLELVSLPKSETALMASITEQQQALETLEAEARNLRIQKDAALAVSSAIAAGVAQIASALREEDCVCPVCQSTFTVAGELKELAIRQASESDQRLIEIETKISQQDEKIREAQRKNLDLDVGLERLYEKREELIKIVSSADQLENNLRVNPLLSGLSINAFLPTLATAAEQNDRQTRDLVAVLSSGPDAIAVRAEIQRLTNLQQGTVSQRDQLLIAIAGAVRDLEQLRSWPSSGRTAEELQATALDMEPALQQAQQDVLDAQSNLEAIQTKEAALKRRLIEKRTQLKQINDQLTALNATEMDLAARWTRQGYEDAPLPESVRRLDEAHENRSLRLHRVAQEHNLLLDGRRRYLAQAELQQLEANLKAECDQDQAQDVDSLLRALNTRLNGVRKQQDFLSNVRQKRTQLLNELKQKATDIRNAVSEPLNANIEKFCAALMSDRTHQVSLNAIANATTAQALLSFQPDGKGEFKNPLLYMSEGQLAATSLCLLFGASATYPWSRWKGLLMDDPLHHNDSIHAAAFIDVVRNLIRSQGYQIIVSTHDMEQAGYFLRKCRNAGITARYLHLYGRAKDGTALVQSA